MVKISVITISVILISLYTYLSLPIQFSYNIMGIGINAKMQYQPLTTCLSYDMTFGVETAHNKKCGISPLKVFQVKTKMKDYIDLIGTGLY